MKLKQISMMLCAASVFVACNKDKNAPAPNAEIGNTYSGLIFGSPNNGLRAATQNDDAGIPSENAITKITLLDVIEKSWSAAAAVSQDADKFWQVTGQSTLYTVKPWKTTAGTRKMGLIANQGDISTSLLQAKDDQVYSTADKVADLATFSTASNFVMTSALADKNVLPNIPEATAETSSVIAEDVTKNIFLFNLERVVAQGLVYSDGLKEVEKTKDGIGSIAKSSLKYTAVNGGAKTYLYATKAGERTMGVDDIYKDFTSAIDDEYKSSYQGAQNARTVEENLIRLGNLIEDASAQQAPDYDFTTIGTKASKLGGYAARPVTDKPESRQAGIYFFENSANKTGLTKENKDFGFYRLAYAKIYAKFTPSKVYVNKGTVPEDGQLTKESLKLEAVTADQAGLQNDGTFYRGTTDHLLYADYKVALANGNATVDVFYKGMCGYRALWNRQTSSADANLVINADARRNNIYQLTITGFETLGMPFDSSDPFDPYLPKVTGTGEDGLPPSDKVNPTPDDPDIEKEETYMRVIAKVLDWNLVTRGGIVLE